MRLLASLIASFMLLGPTANSQTSAPSALGLRAEQLPAECKAVDGSFPVDMQTAILWDKPELYKSVIPVPTAKSAQSFACHGDKGTVYFFQFGSEAQRKKYLPKLASGEWLGCFGLTEPNHGSDPSGMLSNIKDAGDHVVLNGSKMWISNAPFSQVAVVWAKDEQGDVRGMILERGMEGFTTPTTHNKWSLRASATGELVFDHVKVPKENILPNIKGLKGPLSCLTKARYGIAWGTVGAALGGVALIGLFTDGGRTAGFRAPVHWQPRFPVSR